MDSTRRLLVLGGNRYNVAAIQAAQKAGFFTLVADRDPNAPGLRVADVGLPIDLIDTQNLLEAIERQGGVDGIVSMAEVGIRSAAYLSEVLGLRSISTQAAANATSKAAMRRCWGELGRYSVAYAVVRTEEQAIKAAQQLAPFPLILKPDRSFGGSRGVIRVNNIDDLPGAFAFAKEGALPGSDIVIEACVSGTEHSAEVLIWNGQTSVLCIGQKVKSSYPYRVDISVQYPAPLSAAQQLVVTNMCHQAVTALGMTQGAAHIEFAYTADGPVLFELGARCGGGHTPAIAHYVSGVNEFVEACRMACGMPPEQFMALYQRGADYRFLIFPPGVIRSITIPETVRTHEQILDVAATVQVGAAISELRTTSDRSGFVVTAADTYQQAIDIADWACAQIYATYSNDTVANALIP